jgi:hypothetical protein
MEDIFGKIEPIVMEILFDLEAVLAFGNLLDNRRRIHTPMDEHTRVTFADEEVEYFVIVMLP